MSTKQEYNWKVLKCGDWGYILLYYSSWIDSTLEAGILRCVLQWLFICWFQVTRQCCVCYTCVRVYMACDVCFIFSGLFHFFEWPFGLWNAPCTPGICVWSLWSVLLDLYQSCQGLKRLWGNLCIEREESMYTVSLYKCLIYCMRYYPIPSCKCYAFQTTLS